MLHGGGGPGSGWAPFMARLIPALILNTNAPRGMKLLGIPGSNRRMMAPEPPKMGVARRAHGATPDSELRTIGVGHLPWLDEPEDRANAARESLEHAV